MVSAASRFRSRGCRHAVLAHRWLRLEHQFQTALACKRIARIQTTVFRESSQAEAALLQAIGILDKLSQEFPEQPAYVYELAKSYALLGWATNGNIKEEEKWIRRGVD